MGHRFLLSLLILMTALGTAFAQNEGRNDGPNNRQNNEEWYLNKPIVDVEFQGLNNVSENDLQGVVEPFLGNLFTEDVLLDLQRRLYNLEYFDLIIPEAVPGNEERTEMILRFTVEERPVISEIRLQGNQKLRRETILSEIILTQGELVSRSQARIDTDAIISLYNDRGFADVSVEFNYSEDPDPDRNARILSFTIDEGYQTNIRNISFSGINFATENKLRSVIESKEQGLFNPGTFKASNLELDTQNILEYYGQNGYVDAEVLDIEQEIVLDEDKKRQFLDLTYYIDEGIAWFFGGIEFNGNTIFSDEELRSQVNLEEGDVLDIQTFQQGVQAVNDMYYKGGYIFNQINFSETRDEALQQISYSVDIVEQGRAYIENIIVRGNTKTLDEVIYRELPFEEGDVFSASKIRQGIGNLYNTQYFADVPAVETPQGSVPGLMDLIINLEEGQTTDIRLGFSVGGGGDFPLSGLVKWSDNNFLGRGQTIGADLNVSPNQQSLALNFQDGWLFGERWSGGASLQVDRQVKNDELQDVLYPIFDKDDQDDHLSVPDPFTGIYVFSEETEYPNDGDENFEPNYDAGEPFPGVPTASDIDEYNLETDYEYAGGPAAVPDENKMEYVEWSVGGSLSTGIRRRTQLGWINLNGAVSSNLNHVSYDDSLYRPYSYQTRENLGVFKFENRISMSIGLDNRDVYFNPQNGYLIEQRFNYTGGVLGGAKNYIRTDTTLQAYKTLFDLEVSDTWSWKMVLAANSSLSLMLDQFWTYPGAGSFEAEGRLLATNSMTIARGWPARGEGQALLNNWLELRMPISEDILWFDMFGEAVRLTSDRADIFSKGEQDWLFGFGAGLRFSIPQFPFRIYLGKLFNIQNGTVNWQDGNLFNNPEEDGSGLSLIFSISL
ncbi:outer membrane protein assembly factor BamA [Salinispira pacifica]|uniref:Outer membrane protein assembly factor BamA n=1 Tax=Salinispira pacifica TaxID=1307761 RepID=V5WH87_9SPIO|nr:outer membrane protein assembly factor BamA [Salinispira pacifica]AHC15197.1 Outer membrane protein assembly factor YaeT precursor [Salinispira pacifica]